MTTKTKPQLKKECKYFFEYLIERTNTYFLSDYVEDIIDHLSDTETKDIIKTRNRLRKECELKNIDFHGISCDVASKFMETQI